MRLTGVYDNTAEKEGLIHGWGFSLFISTEHKSILFDVGADLTLLVSNLKELEISPSELDGVFLSHPHCDHVGGLSGVLKKNSKLTAFLTRSFPAPLKKSVESYGAETEILTEPREIFEGGWSTGELKGFHKGQEIPEQALVISSSRGPVVISGCAHPGITRIVRRAREITGKSPYLVIGGFHLGSKKKDEVKKVIEKFRAESVNKLVPTHCTGEEAIDLIREDYHEDFVEFGAGAELTI
ncbi:MBL fold metallo-hydrolase [Candidatus Bipolaricaulota bacterium]|nr:MBL fold metallo-hydrolase [Candidatus Bipolaricaulota bacterium]